LRDTCRAGRSRCAFRAPGRTCSGFQQVLRINSASMTKRITAAGIFVLAAIAALAPIRSYDYFWHLTTGRWIVSHHSIPRFDPLTLASAHVPWINGEWLYEIVLYALHGIGGDAGISIMSAMLAAAIFAIGILVMSQDAGVALLIAGV